MNYEAMNYEAMNYEAITYELWSYGLWTMKLCMLHDPKEAKPIWLGTKIDIQQAKLEYYQWDTWIMRIQFRTINVGDGLSHSIVFKMGN